MVPPAMNTSAPAAPIDYEDVQGILRFGHGKLTRACFYPVQIRDAAAARQWLREVPVTRAVTQKPLPVSALQVALTAAGMRTLAVPDHIVESFSPEFVT